MYVTSINDGTQTLTFLGIHNNHDFQNSRFFCGNLIILNPELHWFSFWDRWHLLHSFPESCTHSQVKRIAPKEHLHPTGMMFVRAYVCTSRWKILFTPYLVVELSPSAKIWCVYVTSISDGTQILTFLKIDNNHDFQNSRFFCGNLIILNPELH